jgi:hypothetical protein
MKGSQPKSGDETFVVPGGKMLFGNSEHECSTGTADVLIDRVYWAMFGSFDLSQTSLMIADWTGSADLTDCRRCDLLCRTSP